MPIEDIACAQNIIHPEGVDPKGTGILDVDASADLKCLVLCLEMLLLLDFIIWNSISKKEY